MRKAPFLLLAVLLPAVAGCNKANQDRLSDDQVRATDAAASPEQRCASSATSDRLKQELFGEAARLRRGDGAAVEQLSGDATLRMARARLVRNDPATGLVACRGLLSLDLPEGFEAAGGRRTLSAEVDYALQEAVDGSGDMVTLTGAEAIIAPLATIAPRTSPMAEPPLGPADSSHDGPGEVARPIDDLAPTPLPPPPPTLPQPTPSAPAPEARSSPSFDCRYARTRSEQMVCASDELAELDRRMTALYSGALADADAETRAVLRATRDRFLAFRERCSTESCIAETYRGRMAEIRDILAAGSLRP